VTPIDKRVSYKPSADSREQNGSILRFGWENLRGFPWTHLLCRGLVNNLHTVAACCGSAPSHLLHATGPVQIPRQRLVYLLCKMAACSSLPLTSAGKTARRLSPVPCRPRHGARLPRVGVFREHRGVHNADLAQEGSWGCSLVCKNQFESHTPLLCKPAWRWALTQ